MEVVEAEWRRWGPAPFPLTGDVPPFPTGVLPQWLEGHVKATAARLQCPQDLPGVLVLGVLASACGGFVWVSPDRGWLEGTNLYLAVCLEPGAKKSPAFKTMTAPLFAYEKELRAAARADIAKAETVRLAAEAKSRTADAAAIEKPDDQKLLDVAATARQNLNSTTVPPRPRLLLDDVTPERLATLLAQNKGSLTLASEEGGVFQQIAGRYSGIPNLDIYLKAFSNSAFSLDRADGRTEQLDRPALTILLAVQPAVLQNAAANPAMQSRGLIDRFLLSFPTDIQAYTSHIEGRVASRDDETWKFDSYYEKAIARIFKEVRKREVTLTLSEEALVGPYDTWMAQLTPRKRADLVSLKGFVSKLEGAGVMRIAALLHVADAFAEVNEETEPADWATTPISADTMARAIQFADYFLGHALSSYGDLALSPTYAKGQAVLVWLAETWQRPFVTKRDIQQGMRSMFKSVADLKSVVELLKQENWLRETATTAKKGPGRPRGTMYVVHGSLFNPAP